MSVTQEAKSLDRAIADAARLQEFFTPALRAELHSAISAAFADAQAKVHVLSGSLKASGRHGTVMRDHGDTWIGYMAWGGASAPHDVDYAIYAMANGGDSDWLRDSHVYEEHIDQIIRHHDPLGER